MTPSELLAWAHTETGTVGHLVTPAEAFLARYIVKHLEPGYSSAYMRDAMRLALIQQSKLTPMGLDTAPPLDVTEPVSVQPETSR